MNKLINNSNNNYHYIKSFTQHDIEGWIGHSRYTFLPSGENSPKCPSSQNPLSIKHILLDCNTSTLVRIILLILLKRFLIE